MDVSMGHGRTSHSCGLGQCTRSILPYLISTSHCATTQPHQETTSALQALLTSFRNKHLNTFVFKV